MMLVLLLGLLLTMPTAGPLAAHSPQAEAQIKLSACQAEVQTLQELAQQYRIDGLAGDLTIATVRAQRDALYAEVQRLRKALGSASPDTKGEAE